tara:strand:+ start:981 stop:1112 length:132 start_codon:yes stop_codon:yes gene_type:complete
MKKYEISLKIRYKLNLHDSVEEILMKLSKKDLIEFLNIINERI